MPGRAVSLRTSGTGIWLERPAHAVSLHHSNFGLWLAALLALAGAALLAFLLLAYGRRPVEPQLAALPAVARVTDLTGTLGADEQNALLTKLADFEHARGAQLAVLVLPSTRPETIEQYGIRLADAWKLGRKGVDDGAILIVAKDDHKLRIEVGYGLEGSIPDAVASRIIEETIVPAFRADHFYQGINAGVDSIIHAVDGAAAMPSPANAATAPSAAAGVAQAADQGNAAEEPAAAQPGGAESEEVLLDRYTQAQRRMDREEYLIIGLLVLCVVSAIVLRQRLGSIVAPLAAGALFAAICLLLSHWLEVDAKALAVFGGSIVCALSWAGIRGWSSGGSASLGSSGSGFSSSSDSFGGGGGGFGGGGASGSW